jgi:hypothetical protein
VFSQPDVSSQGAIGQVFFQPDLIQLGTQFIHADCLHEHVACRCRQEHKHALLNRSSTKRDSDTGDKGKSARSLLPVSDLEGFQKFLREHAAASGLKKDFASKIGISDGRFSRLLGTTPRNRVQTRTNPVLRGEGNTGTTTGDRIGSWPAICSSLRSASIERPHSRTAAS